MVREREKLNKTLHAYAYVALLPWIQRVFFFNTLANIFACNFFFAFSTKQNCKLFSQSEHTFFGFTKSLRIQKELKFCIPDSFRTIIFFFNTKRNLFFFVVSAWGKFSGFIFKNNCSQKNVRVSWRFVVCFFWLHCLFVCF